MLRVVPTFHRIVLLTVVLLLASCNEDEPSGVQVPPGGVLRLTVSRYTTAVGHPVEFNVTYQGSTLTNPRYVWDFGDSTKYVTKSADPQTHAYASVGTYQVSVRLLDDQHDIDLIAATTIHVGSLQDVATVSIVVPGARVGINELITLAASYNGPSLDHPEYRWSIDGAAETVRSNDTMSYRFANLGVHKITLKLIDLANNIHVTDSCLIEVVDERQFWQHWKRMEVRVYGRFVGNNGGDPDVSDTSYSRIDTWQINIGSTGNPWTWSGTSAVFDTSYSESMCITTQSVSVTLSPEAKGVNSLILTSEKSCVSGSQQWGSIDTLYIQYLPTADYVTLDSAMYKANGSMVKDVITKLYRKEINIGWLSPEFRTIERGAHSWIEIRFYKQ